jgi:hypothetical protein
LNIYFVEWNSIQMVTMQQKDVQTVINGSEPLASRIAAERILGVSYMHQPYLGIWMGLP